MEELSFRERLAQGPILCDGAMGTQLYARGIPYNRCFDALNVSQPVMVSDIHRAYIAAGAEIIETNTFGANRFKLSEHGLADQVEKINAAGLHLAMAARQEAGRKVFIAGSVGPLGKRLSPLGWLRPAEARAAFAEQIAALAGADLLILETMSDLNEMREASLAAREVCNLPIIAQMTFTEDGHTPAGHSPEEVAAALLALGVEVIGVNCSVGPARVFEVAQTLLREARGHPVSAQPNAGWPERVGDRILYPATPAYFADYARRLADAGVRIIGGCCGTTPEHIGAMRRALDGAPTIRKPSLLPSLPAVPAPEALPRQRPTELAQKLAEGRFVVGVEMSPPKGFDTTKFLEGARSLKEHGADVINVADSPMARMRMSPWAVSYLIQSRLGIEAVLHFPTRGRNLLRVQGDLLAAHALDVRNVFVVMGDPPTIGDYPEASDSIDVVPSGLVRLIKANFNMGLDRAGAPLGQPTSFHVGVALNMGAEDIGREIKGLRKKVEAGADFALTMPVYDPTVVSRFVARAGPLPIPILIGILPLHSHRHAEFLHNEVPGMSLGEEVLERMRKAGSEGRKEGVRMAQELIQALRGQVQGVYLIPSFGRYDAAAEVLDLIR